MVTSVVQGLIIAAAAMIAYRCAVGSNFGESVTRTMVFTVLITANVFLTLVNRSFYYSLLTTLKYKNNLVLGIIALTITACGSLIYIKPLAAFFQFEALTLRQLGLAIGIGFTSVIWYELVKWKKRFRNDAVQEVYIL